MPTTTFYNLPPAKKERLLAAARKEFARVPFNDTSINQIIQEVGISRGSFYTYFTDKVDLAFCVLEGFFNRLFSETEHVLQESHGDIFALFIYTYDFVHDYAQYHGLVQMFNNVLLGLNSDERSNLRLAMERFANKHIETRLLKLINKEALKLHGKEDLEDLLIILFAITKSSCLERLMHSGQGDSRRRFLRRLDMLKFGVWRTEQKPSLL